MEAILALEPGQSRVSGPMTPKELPPIGQGRVVGFAVDQFAVAPSFDRKQGFRRPLKSSSAVTPGTNNHQGKAG
jgi:hypothetical protein